MQKKLFLQELIRVCYEVCHEENFFDLDSVTVARQSENIWRKIGTRYYGIYDHKYSVNVYSWWKRDTNGFQTEFKKFLQKKQSMNEPLLSENEKIKILIKPEEWLKIKKFVANLTRKKFKSEFDGFLSEKIQEKGINCWLKCKWNWFKETNSKKKNSPFWKGVFNCINQDCENKFIAFIQNGVDEKKKSCLIRNRIKYKNQS